MSFIFSPLNHNLAVYMSHFLQFLCVLRGNVAFDWALTGLVIRRL